MHFRYCVVAISKACFKIRSISRFLWQYFIAQKMASNVRIWISGWSLSCSASVRLWYPFVYSNFLQDSNRLVPGCLKQIWYDDASFTQVSSNFEAHLWWCPAWVDKGNFPNKIKTCFTWVTRELRVSYAANTNFLPQLNHAWVWSHMKSYDESYMQVS